MYIKYVAGIRGCMFWCKCMWFIKFLKVKYFYMKNGQTILMHVLNFSNYTYNLNASSRHSSMVRTAACDSDLGGLGFKSRQGIVTKQPKNLRSNFKTYKVFLCNGFRWLSNIYFEKITDPAYKKTIKNPKCFDLTIYVKRDCGRSF